MSRGGRRAGAGRKALPPEARHLTISISLPAGLVRRLDRLRGELSRSAFFERLVVGALEEAGRAGEPEES